MSNSFGPKSPFDEPTGSWTKSRRGTLALAAGVAGLAVLAIQQVTSGAWTIQLPQEELPGDPQYASSATSLARKGALPFPQPVKKVNLATENAPPQVPAAEVITESARSLEALRKLRPLLSAREQAELDELLARARVLLKRAATGPRPADLG